MKHRRRRGKAKIPKHRCKAPTPVLNGPMGCTRGASGCTKGGGDTTSSLYATAAHFRPPQPRSPHCLELSRATQRRGGGATQGHESLKVPRWGLRWCSIYLSWIVDHNVLQSPGQSMKNRKGFLFFLTVPQGPLWGLKGRMVKGPNLGPE